MIDRDKFITTIFAELVDGEYVMVCRQQVKTGGSGYWFSNHLTSDRAWRKWDPEKQDHAWYFCVSTVNGEMNAKGSMVGRGRSNLVRQHAFVLDDIGTKATPPPVEPSWKITTSIVDGVRNEQWGYFLEPTAEFAVLEALLIWCAAQGWGDGGAGGAYRVVRVPGSANLKPGRNMFHSAVGHWKLWAWNVEELVKDMGANLDTLQGETKSAEVVSIKPGGFEALAGVDPMLDWLSAQGLIVNDSGDAWVDIVCPWASEHTTGENIAGYSPLGRGDGDYVPTRAFKCLHEHCSDKRLSDLIKWGKGAGAPVVSGYDPLPWLQARYIYVESEQRVADVLQRPHGGKWMWPLADWKLKHTGKVMMPGADKPVPVVTAFLNSGRTRRAVDTIYRPVKRWQDVGLVPAYGQSFLNTYVPPNHAETDLVPGVFLEHVEFVVPNKSEREVFLNWLAYKLQNPASRSYAVVMVAEGDQGTGRSWFKRLLVAMLQGDVETASLPQLAGLGTAAEQNYNDWMTGCQFLVVEEAKDSSMSREDFYRAYETFKTRVDTTVLKDQRINPKYGRTRKENIYFNALILSNHGDAIAIPDIDRRIFGVANPSKRQSYEYYDRLAASLESDEPARAYWWLMRRDVSGFDHIYPPMTPTKAMMIDSNRAPSDQILEHVLEHHAPDIVSMKSLRSAVGLAARDLDMEKIMREPGGVVRMLWRKLKSLRPDDTKNGARYPISGKQTELRAIRRRKTWLDNDMGRVRKLFEEEMRKTEIESNVVEFRGEREE
jgi:hypothetical protein